MAPAHLPELFRIFVSMKRLLLIIAFTTAALCLQARGLRVALVGDPQVDNEIELQYARKSIYSELKARKDLDLVIILGDLVNDNAGLLMPSKESLDSLPCPWICTPGNHDKDLYKSIPVPRDLASFRGILGYTDSTFTMRGVRFISMDNVRTVDRGGYEAGFTDGQLEWLSAAVSATAEGTLIVFCTHIPVSEMKCQDEIEDIFKGRGNDLVVVCGHTHTISRGQAVLGTEENIIGATCGTWWRGPKDARGIPQATMNCGAPRGYFVMDIKGKDYSLRFKQVKGTREASARVSDDGRLTVNIFGGSRNGKVEYRLNGWKELPHKMMIAPEVQDIIDFNKANKEYTRSHRDEYMPMLTRNSPHIWSAKVPGSGALKGKKMAIRYTDGHMEFKTKVIVD